MKLNEEQKKLVEEAHDLIYWYINLKGLDVSEWYDLMALELCDAVTKFDPSRGQLSTYFTKRMENLTRKQYHKNKRKTPMLNWDENKEVESEELKFQELEVHEWIDSLGKPKSSIIKLKIEGYTQTEIADILGITQGYVSQVLKEIRKDYINDRQGNWTDTSKHKSDM